MTTKPQQSLNILIKLTKMYYFDFALLAFGPVDLLCHRLLHRNAIFALPYPVDMNLSSSENRFLQKIAIVGEFMSGSENPNG